MTQQARISFFLPPILFWGLIGGFVFLRSVMVMLSPLELGVDEAQYWLWGQNLAFGYYSKPPLIGWWLGLCDALFGSSAAAARIGAPLLHGLIATLLYHIAAMLYDRAAAQIAAILWISLPVVGLGSFVISTDSLMLLFWSAGLYCLVRAETHQGNNDIIWLGLAGLMTGFAMLAKYAAIYFVIGMAGFLLSKSRQNPSGGLIKDGLAFIAGCLAGASPTWGWNLLNSFVTVRHLGENANLEIPLYSFSNMAEFIAAQFAVIGPITGVLVCIALVAGRRGTGTQHQPAMLLWFILPPLFIITAQAFIKEANANWAVAAYPAAIILTAGMIGRKITSQGWQIASLSGIGVNIIITLGVGLCLGTGSLGIFTPDSDPLRRLRGWSVLAEDTVQIANRTGANAVLASSRASAAALSWKLADTRLEIVVPAPDAAPSNHYERTAPLGDDTPRPLIAITDIGKYPDQLEGWQSVGSSSTEISANRSREFQFWLLP